MVKQTSEGTVTLMAYLFDIPYSRVSPSLDYSFSWGPIKLLLVMHVGNFHLTDRGKKPSLLECLMCQLIIPIPLASFIR